MRSKCVKTTILNNTYFLLPELKPATLWVTQNFQTFDATDRLFKCDHSLDLAVEQCFTLVLFAFQFHQV